MAGRLLEAIDGTVKSRVKYWAHPRRKAPPETAVATIIEAAVSRISPAGGRSRRSCSLITLLPETVAVVASQAEMTCDVAAALGKPEAVSTELVVGLFLELSGVGSGGILTSDGDDVVVRRLPHASLREALSGLVDRAVVPVLKAVAGERCPVGGAAAMTAWTGHVTRQLGERATEALRRGVRWSDREAAPRDHVAGLSVPPDDAGEWTELRILALTNLMKADRHVRSEETEHIEAVLATSGLPPGATARVQAAMAAPELVPIDHGRFSANPAQALLLMLDLIALARRDGHVRPSERAYLRNVGKEIGYPEEDVVALTGG